MDLVDTRFVQKRLRQFGPIAQKELKGGALLTAYVELRILQDMLVTPHYEFPPRVEPTLESPDNVKVDIGYATLRFNRFNHHGEIQKAFAEAPYMGVLLANHLRDPRAGGNLEKEVWQWYATETGSHQTAPPEEERRAFIGQLAADTGYREATVEEVVNDFEDHLFVNFWFGFACGKDEQGNSIDYTKKEVISDLSRRVMQKMVGSMGGVQERAKEANGNKQPDKRKALALLFDTFENVLLIDKVSEAYMKHYFNAPVSLLRH